MNLLSGASVLALYIRVPHVLQKLLDMVLSVVIVFDWEYTVRLSSPRTNLMCELRAVKLVA